MKATFMVFFLFFSILASSSLFASCGSSNGCGSGDGCGSYDTCGYESNCDSCTLSNGRPQYAYQSEPGCNCDCADKGWAFNDCISKCDYCEAFGNIGAR